MSEKPGRSSSGSELKSGELGRDEIVEFEGPEETGSVRLPTWLTETPYWGISAVVHTILLLMVSAWFVTTEKPEEKKPQRTFVRNVVDEDPYDPLKKPDVKDQELTDPVEKTDVQLTKIKVEPDVPKSKIEREPVNTPVAILGVNSKTPFVGRPDGGEPSGASPGTKDAVRAALEWLRRHQFPDGRWASDEIFTGDCADASVYADEKPGVTGFDAGVTGLGVLAFTGYGHTHRGGYHEEYVPVCRNAMKWLLDHQVKSGDPRLDGGIGILPGEDGEFSEGAIYNHAIATMALAELLVMSNDQVKLRKPVERATAFILESKSEGLGWRYQYQSPKSDSSVTGWMLLALKTVQLCDEFGLVRVDRERVDAAVEDGLRWFDLATSRSDFRCGYTGPGDPGAQWQDHAAAGAYPYSKDLSCMTAVSVLCQIFGGRNRKDDLVKGGVALLTDHPPLWREKRGKSLSTVNFYYWYYGTYALFQYGGRQWKQWNESMLDALLPTQVRLTDKDGSWDPVGEWGAAGGRAYATAIGALTLEVYYRFMREEEGRKR